jgi:zinc transport system ATP-binding protein
LIKNIISLNSVSVKYNDTFALKDISFNVNEGDYLCIVGENGSGKSTLVKSILGLVKPNRGTIQFNNLKQNQIGFIPQQTFIQKDFPTSVFEIVLSGCISKQGILPFYTRNNKQLAVDNIKRLGIENLIHKSYCDLSIGQQQRVLLARALCSTEKVLILDEPVTGLDPLMTNELHTLLEILNKQGTTIIMISHNIASVLKYANKILHIQTSILFFGETNEYLKSPIYNRMIGGGTND